MSLDGYTAGPEQSVDNPLGIGGMRLHDWAFPLAAWRAPHGLKGGKIEGVEDLSGLELVRTVAAPNVTHLKFGRR